MEAFFIRDVEHYLLDSDIPGFDYQLCHVLVVRLWAR